MEKEFKAYNKKQREAGLNQISYSNYMRMMRGTDKPTKKSIYTTGYVRPSPKIPSGDMFDTYKGDRKPEKKYTGDRLIGIATMHKSNSVPVFRKEDAEDIARMRR